MIPSSSWPVNASLFLLQVWAGGEDAAILFRYATLHDDCWCCQRKNETKEGMTERRRRSQKYVCLNGRRRRKRIGLHQSDKECCGHTSGKAAVSSPSVSLLERIGRVSNALEFEWQFDTSSASLFNPFFSTFFFSFFTFCLRGNKTSTRLCQDEKKESEKKERKKNSNEIDTKWRGKKGGGGVT